jgi:hypothetical protein
MGESYGIKVKIAIGHVQTQQPISYITKRMKISRAGSQRGQVSILDVVNKKTGTTMLQKFSQKVRLPTLQCLKYLFSPNV